MGFQDHASFVLEDRMAKNPKTVLQFITDLSGIVLSALRSSPSAGFG